MRTSPGWRAPSALDFDAKPAGATLLGYRRKWSGQRVEERQNGGSAADQELVVREHDVALAAENEPTRAAQIRERAAGPRIPRR